MLTQEQINELQTHPISWSRLKHYDRSPAHFLENWLNPPEETPAMTLGRALHCLVLEPGKFEVRYVAAPEGIDRRTKDGKAAWAAFVEESKGKTVITAEQMEQAQGMAQAIAASNAASRALAMCPRREHSIEWEDFATSLPCKGVIDAWGEQWAIDLKTTDDAGDRAFARAIANYGYHGQAAFYLDGLGQGSHGHVQNFLFIAVEKNPPHGVRVFSCSPDLLATGRQLYLKLLGRHAECVAAGEWPGYPDEVEPINLPAWAA